ncbi:MAG: P-loop NTPase [Propionibacteriaceae bacterium]|nr:P-loop NTPase [Propionibacteriaceae bacterium]
MTNEQMSTTLLTTDTRLADMAQASAAAIGSSLSVMTDPQELRTVWRTSAVILIGADQVGQVAGWALPRRDQTYLVGQADSQEALCRWSMPLGASVIVLPEGGKWLSRVIAGRGVGSDTGTVVAVRGGVGGVGVSTLCAGVALAAARRPLKVALVDCDPQGGGLDLLLGAENTPGWRWDKLKNAVGQIADITPMLPNVEGITLVSMTRPDPVPVSAQAFEAVIDCLARTHQLVLIDQGRTDTNGGSVVRRSVVVSAQTVRALAATRASVIHADVGQCGLVIRKGGSVSAGDAARAVELPLVAVLPTVAELPRLADRGVPPWPSGGWKRACVRVLQWCLGETSGARRLR